MRASRVTHALSRVRHASSGVRHVSSKLRHASCVIKNAAVPRLPPPRATTSTILLRVSHNEQSKTKHYQTRRRTSPPRSCHHIHPIHPTHPIQYYQKHDTRHTMRCTTHETNPMSTCSGLRSERKRLRRTPPCLPPDLELTNTTSGQLSSGMFSSQIVSVTDRVLRE